MEPGPVTVAVVGAATVGVVVSLIVTARRRASTRPSAMNPHLQGDVLRGGGSARYLVTFDDGTTTEVEADGYRIDEDRNQVILLHHVIDLTGGHEEEVARLDEVRDVTRVDR